MAGHTIPFPGLKVAKTLLRLSIRAAQLTYNREGLSSFPRNNNAALPVRAQKTPLTLSGLKKMAPGWRLRPRVFVPQARVRASGVREDMRHEYTCFGGVKTHGFMDDAPDCVVTP
jgi:hypothetical protein